MVVVLVMDVRSWAWGHGDHLDRGCQEPKIIVLEPSDIIDCFRVQVPMSDHKHRFPEQPKVRLQQALP